MSKVIEEAVPNTVLIKKALPQVDFADTFATVNRINSLEEIVQLIFGQSPKWVMVLMRIRNFLVRLVGIRVEKPRDQSFVFEEGKHIAFFKIYKITDNETILGADDTHLNFRVSVLKDPDEKYNVKVTTLVAYQNRLGRIYMFFVKPFHRMVVKRMVKQAYRSE